MPRLGRHLSLLILGVVLASGHLGLLRVVAWTSMLAERISEEPLELAISTTFDGEHPCGLCRVLDEQDPAAQAKGTTIPKVVMKLRKAVGLLADGWMTLESGATHDLPPCPEVARVEGVTRQPPVPPPIRS